MIQWTTNILKFEKQGEKTGWTYIHIPADLVQQLMPGNKKSFRVKGLLDEYTIEGVALIPMGGGDFILPLNATIRKGIKKRHGAMLKVKLEADTNPVQISEEFILCLEDEPKALAFFKSLARGHQHYFSKWIESAKTEQTKSKRIAMAVTALARQWDFGLMLREEKKKKDEIL